MEILDAVQGRIQDLKLGVAQMTDRRGGRWGVGVGVVLYKYLKNTLLFIIVYITSYIYNIYRIQCISNILF